MRKKSKWPNDPESSEAIRRLNWFIEVGFVVESIDFSCQQKLITMTGDCWPDDIGEDYIEGGPFRINFIGIRNFSIHNLHQLSCSERLQLRHPRDFTIEKDLSHNRYYHLKTSSLNDRFGFEIDFDELEIQQIISK